MCTWDLVGIHCGSQHSLGQVSLFWCAELSTPATSHKSIDRALCSWPLINDVMLHHKAKC